METVVHAIANEAARANEMDRIVYRKNFLRIIPFIFVCYCFAYIDRINLGFTKLQMSAALNIDATWFGIAAGAFFLTYALCEIPSNLLLAKWGARRTFLRIMVLWGGATMVTAFISSVGQLVTLRLLLGAFEAGFLPGIVLYLTFWFPVNVRARVTAVIFIANSVGGALAAPLSGWIMTSFDGTLGLAGWRWVFLLEGAPACLLGFLCFFYLKDGPSSANWLSAAQKARLAEQLTVPSSPEHGEAHRFGPEVFANPTNYLVAYLFFAAICCNYLLFFWLPTIVRESGVESLIQVGILSALPLVCGCVGAISISWSSDVLRERRWHLTFCFVLMAASLLASTMATTLPMILTAFAVASFTTGAVGPLIFSIPPSYLSSKAAPAGIAFISTLGGIAGFASPPALGYIKTATGSLSGGVVAIAVLCAIGALAVAFAIPDRALKVRRAIGVEPAGRSS